jgi:hypothetical protein
VEVVLGHLLGDLSEVALDVDEVGAVLEQVSRNLEESVVSCRISSRIRS